MSDISVPERLENGDWPDADRFMADYDFLMAINFGTFISNGGLEDWGTLTFTNPSDGAALATDWTLAKSGTSAATADVTRESTTIDTDSGTYSLKVNITVAGSANSLIGLVSAGESITGLAGYTIAYGAKVRAATATKVRLKVTDGTTTAYSDYHTGGSTFENLVVSIPVVSSATTVTCTVQITSDFTGAVYLDNAFLYIVPAQISETGLDGLSYVAFLDLYGGALVAGGGSATLEYVAYTVGSATGTYSGSTTVFDLPFTYTADGTNIQVFYNGQQLKYSTDYSESSTTQVTMASALLAGQAVWFRAVAGDVSAPSSVTLYREDYVVGTPLNNYTGSTTIFNLVHSYSVGSNAMLVTLDGVVQAIGASADYLETSSNIVTFNTALVAGQRVSLIWSQTAGSTGVNSGTANQLAYYAGTGSTVSGTPAITTDGTTLTTTIPAALKGTATNNDAAAGNVGEYMESVVSAVSAAATGVYKDLTSLTLTAGDWDMTAIFMGKPNGANVTAWTVGIGTVTGNSSTGLVDGSTSMDLTPPNATASNTPGTISGYRVSISGSTTYYFKMRGTFTVATPTGYGRLSARRVR